MKIIDQGHQEQGLHRRLATWQLTMIAIGGAIGVGLFLGSAVTIQIAGPAVLISYIAGAIVAMIMGYALAEMVSAYPVAGSFGVYADKYVGPWAGFTVRLTYPKSSKYRVMGTSSMSSWDRPNDEPFSVRTPTIW